LAWQCERWGALPEVGGVLDQPAGLLERMSLFLNVYNVHKSYYNATNSVEWTKRNPEAWRLVAKVQRMQWQLQS